MISDNVKGVGFNLRLDYIDEFLELKPDISFVEIITDNWHSEGPHHKKLEKVRQDYDLSFHCVGMNIGGIDPIDISYLTKTKELSDIYKPFQISDHLSFQKMNGVSFHDLLPFPFTSEALKLITNRVLTIQEHLQTSILIENLSYYTEYIESSLSEVDFLNKLVTNTDSKILFDLNNIWVNDKNLNINMLEYLDTVLWDKVAEVHLAGPDLFDGVYIDTHGSSVHEDILEIIKVHSNKLQNLPVVYERDSNLPEFSAIMEEIEKIEGIING